MKTIKIGNKLCGGDHPCLVMVDAGVNHNNSVDLGIRIIDAAADSGADIVKFQTYKAGAITTKTAPRYWSDHLNDDDGGTQYDTFSKLDRMTVDGYRRFKSRCQERGVIFSSTPFGLEDADLLESIGMDVFKISSSDLTYIQLIKRVARIGKPVILSTGCASLKEIHAAVAAIRSTGNGDVILQHCILQYPCDDANANLVKMLRIQQEFPECPVGYSDHTIGELIPSAAVAMGAKVIEKHFTIDNSLPDSPDHKLSANAKTLTTMVAIFRRIEQARGVFCDGHYPAEEQAHRYARKSVVSVHSIRKGTIIQSEMLTCKRPGTGFYPKELENIVGRTASKDIEEDRVITESMLG